MRIYRHGKVIPMDQVTWAVMCSPATLVTLDDPGQQLPDFSREVGEAVDALMKFCAAT